MKLIYRIVIIFFLMSDSLLAKNLLESEYSIETSDLERLNDNSISVRYPELNYSYDNAIIKIGERIDMDKTKGFNHEKNIRDINNTSPKKEIIRSIREKLINDIMIDKSLFNYMIGYHEIIPPQAIEKERKQISHTKFEEIHLLGRYGQEIKAVCGFENERQGLIILLPGRGGDIYGMFGLKKLDYSNNSALHYYNKVNTNICALEVYRRIDIPLKRYGLSGKGVDIANVIDFIHWVTKKQINTKTPLFVGGVSNGGHLAEYIGVIDERVQGIISAGSAVRYDYPNSVYSKVSLDPDKVSSQDNSYTSFNFLFRGNYIYRLLFPKALLISIGTHDAGYKTSSTSLEYEKISQIISTKKMYDTSKASNCFATNIFFGRHAMDPKGEVTHIKKLIENCILQ